MGLEGVLVVDKPAGLTSSDVVQRVRRTLHIEKAGHTGTLDPLATGVLPVCLGRATALANLLTAESKRYQARLRLGARTDSGDAQGKVTEEKPVPALAAAQVEGVLASLRGKQQQTPPMVSAVKVDGKRLYELAREGLEVERSSREIEIHALTLLRWREGEIDFEVHCSKGTYVRVLGEEIAALLGTVGHLTALRRTASGAFTLAQAVALEGLTEAIASRALIPMVEALIDVPRVVLAGREATGIAYGKVPAQPAPGPAGPRLLLDGEGNLLALAAADETGKLSLSRVLVQPASR